LGAVSPAVSVRELRWPADGCIINSIAATTTSTGLKVYAQLDERDYPQGVEVSDAQLAAVNLHPDDFHGEWNYTIKPSTH
jgi:hypothetical protein